MSNKFVSFLMVTCLTLFVACGGKEQEITVQSIAISQPSAEMVIGETLNLKATVSPSNATYDGITWTSTKLSVATVSESGQVSALAEGNTTITAMAGGKTASCSITVIKGYVAVSSIRLNKESVELVEGDAETLTATVSPNDATDKTVSWASSNTGVATVKDGTITAIKEGEATITAKAGEKTATCQLVVAKKVIPVETIELNKTKLELVEGDSETITATIIPDNATDKSVTWSSSNPSVATVSSSGEVSAISIGEATITVTTNDGGKKASCVVTVNPVIVTGVILNITTLSLRIGISRALTATVTPANATDKSVTWSSSNPSVATVSSSGEVSAISIGEATITVTTNDGGKTASCKVYVAEAIPVPEAVDLGLPSGLKWASFNLGASKPEEAGDYYAWGETEPYYSSLDPLTWKEGKEAGYAWASYKWCMGDVESLTKYNNNSAYGYNGFTDNKFTLDLEDDAANVNLGGNWRMPTQEEIIELRNNCTITPIITSTVVMNRYTSKINGNSIIIPQVGRMMGSVIDEIRNTGYFWSSRPFAYEAYTGESYITSHSYGREGHVVTVVRSRCDGIPIRPVYSE